MSKVGGSPGDGWSPEDQTEVLVAEILQNEGWTLARAPFIDSESEYGENAPGFRTSDGFQIMPDILAMKHTRTVFVEVKYKGDGACYIYKNDQYEHFIDNPNWEHYHDVRARSGVEVWLVIFEADTHTFQRQEIDKLDVCGNWTEGKVEEHNGSKYGNTGVFVPQRMFMPTQISSHKAPDNFFGQDRIQDPPEFEEEFLPNDDDGADMRSDGGSPGDDDGQSSLDSWGAGDD